MDSSLAGPTSVSELGGAPYEKALVVMFTVLPGGSLDGSALVAAHSFG